LQWLGVIMAWYSAKELEGLPGVPANARDIRKKAQREKWLSREVKAKGGPGGKKIKYHITSLPEETQACLNPSHGQHVEHGRDAGREKALSHTISATVESDKKQHSLAQAIKNTGKENRQNARLQVILALAQFQRSVKRKATQATHDFVNRYNHREAGLVDAWVYEQIKVVSYVTLWRWKRTIETQGAGKLCGEYAKRNTQNLIDKQPDIADFIRGMLTEFPHAKAASVIPAIETRYSNRPDINLPSQRTVERWINNYKKQHAQLFTAISNPDKWKNQFMVAYGSLSEDITALNQVWELDSTPADLMLTDGRHNILGVIDVYTRRPKLLVSKTSKAVSVATLLRSALLDWGVPQTAKTDNGADYKSQHITRVLMDLGINQELCPPFQPWHKPHIERFFRAFSHSIFELLPGYIGHDVAQRKGIEARKAFSDRLFKKDAIIDVKMSSEQLQQFCDDWIDDIYMHRIHRGISSTPLQMVVNWRHPIQRITNERALDILLATAPNDNGFRVVGKKGIRLDHYHYIAVELEAYTGHKVHVRFDPHDMGRVYVFGGDNLDFVCVAEAPELTGISRKDVAEAAKRRQRERIQQAKRELKTKAKNLNIKNIAAEIIEQAQSQNGNVSMFPKSSESYTSNGLNASAKAAQANEPATLKPDVIGDDEFAKRREKIIAQQQAAAVQQPVFNTPFERAMWIAMQQRERILTTEESGYLERFQKEHPGSWKNLVDLIKARYGES